MSIRNKLRILAAQREEARADARAAFVADSGKHASAYSGETPRMVEGRYSTDEDGNAIVTERSPFNARQIGWNTRELRGTTIRTGKKGTLKFVPFRDAEPEPRQPARSYGGNVGHKLVDDTPGFGPNASLCNRPASMPRPEGS